MLDVNRGSRRCGGLVHDTHTNNPNMVCAAKKTLKTNGKGLLLPACHSPEGKATEGRGLRPEICEINWRNGKKWILNQIDVLFDHCLGSDYYFFSFGCTGSQRTRSSTKLGNPHNATLRTLGVLYSLLVVEGQGAPPRASGIRKQAWVSSADAGVCHAWKAAGKVTKHIVYKHFFS